MNNIQNLFINTRTVILALSLVILLGGKFCYAANPPAFEGKELMLSEKAKENSTVGTLLVYFKDGKGYALLVKNKSFYSDFEGYPTTDETYGQAMLSALNNKTQGKFKLSTLELERDSYIVHNQSNGKDFVYSIYSINKEQFDKLSKDLITTNASDQFLWLALDDLSNIQASMLAVIREFDMKGIDNKNHKIQLEPVYIDTCLATPDFKEIISHLRSNR